MRQFGLYYDNDHVDDEFSNIISKLPNIGYVYTMIQQPWSVQL